MSEDEIEQYKPLEVVPKTITGNQSQDGGIHLSVNNQNTINVFGHVQGFDQLEQLSPDVRAAALQYLEREQGARLQYVAIEQRNEHNLAEKGQAGGFKIQAQAIVVSSAVFVATLVICAYMAIHGQTGLGIGIVLGEAAAAVALVVYGEKKRGEMNRKIPSEAANEGPEQSSNEDRAT